MKKIFVVITLMMSFYSCKSQDLDILLKASLSKIIDNSITGNLYYDDVYLFLEKENNIIAVFDIDELRRLYFGKHIPEITGELTFDEFVRNVVNKEIDLGCDKLCECFLLDKRIEEDYLSLGFRKFKEKYTRLKFSSGDLLLETSDLNVSKLYSVMYYFYLNGYFSAIDDYGGGYVSRCILDEEVPQVDNSDIILEAL